jgi:hypothetical protein
MRSEFSHAIPPPSQHTAVELPDGEIQYCKPISINRNNPYLSQPLNDDNTQDYREVECNGEIITIRTDTLTNALNLQCKGQVVRFLCLLDFVMNVLIAMSTYYGSLYSAIVAGISLVGYYSTFTFSRKGLITYLLYQYVQTLCKFTVLGLYIALISGWNPPELKNNKYLIIDVTPKYALILSLSVVGQVYINYFVQHFYNLLPPRAIRQEDQVRFTIA